MDAALEELGDVEIKKLDLLIKHYSLEKEKGHDEGFKPEPGEHDLLTTFTLRPTSETIIYPYFRNKIKTHCDLPMKVNPWVKIIRWEVSDRNPLIRCREFDCLEGHSTFATKEEAYDEVLEFLALTIVSMKIFFGKDKFSGADYTTNVEANGRGVQGVPSSLVRKNIKSTVWQKRYQAVVMPVPFRGADTKRIFGECEAVKSILQGVGVRAIVDERDNYACGWKYADWEMKDVLLRIKIGPSELEKNQVRIVRPVVMPVPFKGADTKRIFGECEAVKSILQGVGVRAIVDERDNYACRWKYADWEMKDVLLRIKIGPSELEKNQVRIVRRDTGVKMDVVTVDLVKGVNDSMEEIHRGRFFVAKRKLEESIQKVETWDECKESLRQKKLSLAPWCE
ncbi:hypothetical protein Bca52824_023846 [Brassica carinata]|uniref:Proline--tRNA ligase n=1 Tax=Brassica carinata TaxID=52824 RepID=A0A8X7VJB7_BRACI|nr:hypothetical protein Bca52824_023846 [Brassica carinata]